MGEYESNMRYAKAVGADIRKPTIDRRSTSQRITDEMIMCLVDLIEM